MVHHDFIVRFDPKTETSEDLSRKILYSLFVRRIMLHKPVICFVGGDSGEGKSWGVLKLQQVLLEIYGKKLEEFLDDINVYVPIEYPRKLTALLEDKRLKQVNIIAIHEARDIIKAKLWHGFVSMAVADINAQVRSVKRLIIFIVSQFIRDITTDMRYTLTYYCTCHRPMGGGGTRIRISKMWKDDRDLEKPQLKKRKIGGVILFPDGTHRIYRPAFLEVTAPSKEITDRFETSDREAKTKIIKGKLARMIKEMEMEMDVGNPKVDAMVKFYTENPDSMKLIGRRVHNKWKLNKDVLTMHDLNHAEFNDFQTKLDNVLKEHRWFNKQDELDFPESAEDAESKKKEKDIVEDVG